MKRRIIVAVFLIVILLVVPVSAAEAENTTLTQENAAALVRTAYNYHKEIEYAFPWLLWDEKDNAPDGYFPISESEITGGSLAAYQERVGQVLSQEYTESLFTRNWSVPEYQQFVRDETGRLLWCYMGSVQYSPFYLQEDENPIESLEVTGSSATCRCIVRKGGESLEIRYTYYSCEFSVENGVWKITGGEYPRALTDLAYAIEIKDKHLFTSPATGDDTPRTVLFCTAAMLLSAFGAHIVWKTKKTNNTD